MSRWSRGWLSGLAFLLSGCVLTPHRLPTSVMRYWDKPPTRMVMVLSPTRLEQNGVPVHQGMMCRVYFFHETDPVPVLVEGDLEITAYDQGAPAPAPPAAPPGAPAPGEGEEGSIQGPKTKDPNRPPDGRYEIPAQDLPAHVRKDIVGDSYLFWLPFEPKEKTQVLVLGRFRTHAGSELTSGLVSLELEPALQAARVGVKRRPSQRAQLIQQLASAADARSSSAEAGKETAPGGTTPEAVKSSEPK